MDWNKYKEYFDFVQDIYDNSMCRVIEIWKEVKDLENQKEFALAVQGGTTQKHEQGLLFNLRKESVGLYELIKRFEPKKIAKGLQLKEKFAKKFGIEEEDE